VAKNFPARGGDSLRQIRSNKDKILSRRHKDTTEHEEDGKNRFVRAAKLAALLLASTIFAIPGCVDRFGTGGTGETVIPFAQLHDVGRADLNQYAIPPAASRPATRPAATRPAASMTLSIEECRLSALQNNLDLAVELFNPTIARAQVTQEEAAFEAVFNGSATYSQNKLPAAGGVPSFTQTNLNPDFNVGIPLQTGGTIKLDAPYQYASGTYVSQALSSFYTFTPNISISQPLLRGFGFDVNANSIRIAFYQYQQSQARTKLEVIRVLAETDRAYWHLYASRKLLAVRQQQLELAVKQFERAKRQAKVGMVAAVDIVRAESGVADQEEQIIIAANTVRQRERDLKRILNRADLSMDAPTQIVLGNDPNPVEIHLDPSRVVSAALAQRMELLDVELQIVAETANVRFARNQLLPLLAVQYAYAHNGYSNSIHETFDQVWNRDLEGHTVGLTLQFPIGNEAAKSQLRQAMLRRLQQLATKQQRQAQICQEVFDTTDTLNTDWQRILAAHKRAVLAQRVMEVESHQFDIGLRTSTEVLDAQAKFADAQASEIAAITDYQIAQVDLAVATGTVLGAAHVRWEAAGKEVERSVK
jgi:outer membrane protein TolC